MALDKEIRARKSPGLLSREDEYWMSQAKHLLVQGYRLYPIKEYPIGIRSPPTMIRQGRLEVSTFLREALNLLTFDSFKVFDPETDNQDGRVSAKANLYVGVNLNFNPIRMKNLFKYIFGTVARIILDILRYRFFKCQA